MTAIQKTVSNLVVEIEGTDDPDAIVIVGAHYDSVPGSPGANDNASAVAALIELARKLRDNPAPHTVRLVSFVNEEPPFFQSELMGSYVFAQKLRDRDERVTAMMSMDGLGYYSDEPDSQSYPVTGIGTLYPTRGDFIAFVGRTWNAGLVRRAVGAFRDHAAFPAHGAALPQVIPGVGWSDHWAFWQAGFPAFFVTDTLPYRDPAYHSPADTPDRLDYDRMARVVEGLEAVIRDLAR